MAKLNAKNAVVQSAFIVTLLSVCERAFGFLYRVVLSRNLGAEGMGYYYITLSVFSVFLSVAVSGIPAAVNRLSIKFRAQGDPNKASGVITAGVITAGIYGVGVCLLLLLLKNFLGFLFTDERCVSLLMILCPGLIFCAVYAVIRASFWANHRFTECAVFELIEEILLVLFGSLAVTLSTSAYQGTRLATLCLTLCAAFPFGAALWLFFKRGSRFSTPKGTLRPLFSSAIPVTGMRVASSLTSSLVAVVFPLRLIAAGLNKTAAVASYAAASAMAAPLLFAPCTVIGSISLVLVPKLSGEYYGNRKKEFASTISSALNAAILLAFLLFPVLTLFGGDLCLLLYRNAQAGALVGRFSMLVLPMTLALMSMSILNSMGHEKLCMLFSLAGNVCMVLCAVLLPPLIRENALFVGYFFDYGVTALLNLIFLKKKLKKLPGLLMFALKNAAAALPAVALGYFLIPIFSVFLPRLLAVVLGTACAFACQAMLLLTLGGIRLLKSGQGRKRGTTARQTSLTKV